MCTREEFLDKAHTVNMEIKDQLNRKSIKYNWHEADVTVLEGVFARGDRRLSRLLLRAYEKGCLFDSWTESFDNKRWMEAFEECGLDPEFYACRERRRDEVLPWSMISCYVSDDYLWRQRELAYQSVTTPDCRTQCSGCGANKMVGGTCDV